MAGRKSKDFSVRIPVSGGATAIVDSADVELVKQYAWHLGGDDHQSVVSSDCGITVHLEHLIMGTLGGGKVIFTDGNKFNFRRSNLHISAPHSVSGFRGVVYHPQKQRFQARVHQNRHTFRGPYRLSAKEAAEDYDAMARGLFLNNAILNFPENKVVWIKQPSEQEKE